MWPTFIFRIHGGALLWPFCCWLVAWPACQRQWALQEIERTGAVVDTQMGGPQWWRQWSVAFGSATMIDCESTDIIDDGLRHLSGLPNLVVVHLDDTQVTDDGRKHLIGLTNLHTLLIEGTNVTKAGEEMLQAALPKCRIEWNSTNDTP